MWQVQFLGNNYLPAKWKKDDLGIRGQQDTGALFYLQTTPRAKFPRHGAATGASRATAACLCRSCFRPPTPLSQPPGIRREFTS